MTTEILSSVTFFINWLTLSIKTKLLSQTVSEFTEEAFSLSTTQYYQNWVKKTNQDSKLSTFLQHKDNDFLNKLAELKKDSSEKVRRKAPSRSQSSSLLTALKKSGIWKEKLRDSLQNQLNLSLKSNQNQSLKLSNKESNLNSEIKLFTHYRRALSLYPVN